MSQHDMNIANSTGASVRADINSALAALVSLSSGATEPTTTYAYMVWLDTTTGRLKIRNAADNAWVVLAIDIDNQTITTGNINEATPGSGVTIDSLTIKDAGFALGSDADGDIYFRSGGALVRLAKGAAGESLIMNVGETAPEWGLPETDVYNFISDTSTLVFYQASAPTGWTRDTTTVNDRALRATTNVGGTLGGLHSFATGCNRVYTHTHPLSVSTSGSGSHDHQLVTTATTYLNDGGDNRIFNSIFNTTGSGGTGVGSGIEVAGVNINTTGSTHSHTSTGTSSANSGNSTWVPTFMNVIICTKD